MIELDSGVGTILQKLKSLSIDKDTLVIFSSDNGGATYAKEQGIKKRDNIFYPVNFLIESTSHSLR